MSNLESCDLCGTHTSGVKNERFKEYQNILIKAAISARDEKALVFVAKDMLDNLLSVVGSSSRLLSHEEYCCTNKVISSRYAYVEDSLSKVTTAIKCLEEVKKSLEKHLGDVNNVN